MIDTDSFFTFAHIFHIFFIEKTSLTTACSICDRYKYKKTKPPPHSCQKDYNGTAQSMETEAAVPAYQSLQNYGVIAAEITGDCDTKTFN